ncbi:hypothetical protein VP01_1077g3 [Puccinia sorghi]|uniref:Uncharacterized protein n=1 Tax=Puccinia sorghi TaxID=27349 RepID=A0A0L6VUW5_9BASI|nr:hypothetical protein VP01_1077g3 [Puccinia sorghi]
MYKPRGEFVQQGTPQRWASRKEGEINLSGRGEGVPIGGGLFERPTRQSRQVTFCQYFWRLMYSSMNESCLNIFVRGTTRLYTTGPLRQCPDQSWGGCLDHPVWLGDRRVFMSPPKSWSVGASTDRPCLRVVQRPSDCPPPCILATCTRGFFFFFNFRSEPRMISRFFALLCWIDFIHINYYNCQSPYFVLNQTKENDTKFESNTQSCACEFVPRRRRAISMLLWTSASVGRLILFQNQLGPSEEVDQVMSNQLVAYLVFFSFLLIPEPFIPFSNIKIPFKHHSRLNFYSHILFILVSRNFLIVLSGSYFIQDHRYKQLPHWFSTFFLRTLLSQSSDSSVSLPSFLIFVVRNSELNNSEIQHRQQTLQRGRKVEPPASLITRVEYFSLHNYLEGNFIHPSRMTTELWGQCKISHTFSFFMVLFHQNFFDDVTNPAFIRMQFMSPSYAHHSQNPSKRPYWKHWSPHKSPCPIHYKVHLFGTSLLHISYLLPFFFFFFLGGGAAVPQIHPSDFLLLSF